METFSNQLDLNPLCFAQKAFSTRIALKIKINWSFLANSNSLQIYKFLKIIIRKFTALLFNSLSSGMISNDDKIIGNDLNCTSVEQVPFIPLFRILWLIVLLFFAFQLIKRIRKPSKDQDCLWLFISHNVRLQKTYGGSKCKDAKTIGAKYCKVLLQQGVWCPQIPLSKLTMQAQPTWQSINTLKDYDWLMNQCPQPIGKQGSHFLQPYPFFMTRDNQGKQ